MGRVGEPGLYEGYAATKEIGNKEILGKGGSNKGGMVAGDFRRQRGRKR